MGTNKFENGKKVLKNDKGLKNGGFSLIEILIAIAVIAILATVVVNQIGGGASAEAKATQLQDTVRNIKSAVDRFAMHVGSYPGAIKYLWDGKDSNGKDIANWKGPYLQPDYIKDDKVWLKFLGDDTTAEIACTETTDGATGKVELEIENVPPNIATLYDEKFDDGNTSSGKVKYSNNKLTITLTEDKYVAGKHIYCIK